MEILNVKNPIYTGNTAFINCEVLFEGQSEYFPFTASLNDPEQYGKDLYAQIVNGEWGEIAPYVPTPQDPEEIKQRNKATATQLLQQTDWTATLDISDPQYSNPHLINPAEFLAYRSQIRQVAVNPPTTPVEFPAKPEAVWSDDS